MNWPVPELASLLAVAAATLDENGRLLDANAGFLRFIGAEGLPAPGRRFDHVFRQPAFASLLSAKPDPEGNVHSGLLTLNDATERSWTLRGRIWREGGGLRVLAEYDIQDMERLTDVLLELNRDYADAQLKLAHGNLAMQQLNALLTREKRELEEATGRVRRLEGMISICVSCKKLRAKDDDEDKEWQQLEKYLSDNSDAVFSHGICPDCFEVQLRDMD